MVFQILFTNIDYQDHKVLHTADFNLFTTFHSLLYAIDDDLTMHFIGAGP